MPWQIQIPGRFLLAHLGLRISGRGRQRFNISDHSEIQPSTCDGGQQCKLSYSAKCSAHLTDRETQLDEKTSDSLNNSKKYNNN